MKKEDLRIGNACGLMLNHSDAEQINIDASDLVAISQCEIAGKNHGYYPIKLTKDRLLEMGGKPMHNGIYISITNLKSELHFEIHPNTDEIVTVLKSDFAEVIFDRIEYVHDVQNLYYSITKEELVLAATPKRKN